MSESNFLNWAGFWTSAVRFCTTINGTIKFEFLWRQLLIWMQKLISTVLVVKIALSPTAQALRLKAQSSVQSSTLRLMFFHFDWREPELKRDRWWGLNRFQLTLSLFDRRVPSITRIVLKRNWFWFWTFLMFETCIKMTISYIGWILRILGFSTPRDELLFLISEFLELSKSFNNILFMDEFSGNFDPKIHF